MQLEDFKIINQIFETLPSLREVMDEEEKVHKKVNLIVRQLEVQEKASKELDEIRTEMNNLNK